MPLICDKLTDILLFAGDAKISKNIIDINDKNKLQVALNNVSQSRTAQSRVAQSRSRTWLYH